MTFETCLLFMLYVDYGFNNNNIHYIAKSIGSPPSNEQVDYLVISMSTNLNVKAYNDILGNCVLLIL